MKRLHFALFGLLSLLWLACSSGSQSPEPIGNHRPDDAPQPDRGHSSAARPWSAEENLLDPNGFDPFPGPAEDWGLPFNSAFIQKNGIRSVEVRIYNDDLNELGWGKTEAGMQLSQRHRYAFGTDGRLVKLSSTDFLPGAASQEQERTWEWEPGEPIGLFALKSSVGVNAEMPFSLDANGRIIEADAKGFFEAQTAQDEQHKISYLAFRANGTAWTVYAMGGKGTWSDFELVKETYLDLTTGFSETLPLKGISTVHFLETDGRKILTEFGMNHKKQKDPIIERKYNEDGNITYRKYNWDVAGADIATNKHLEYYGNGDLLRIFAQRKRFNGDISNSIDSFAYDSQGMLKLQTRTESQNQSAPSRSMLAFFSFELGASRGAESLEAQPGGTR